jgi:small subunit ribosomal protein S27Ae
MSKKPADKKEAAPPAAKEASKEAPKKEEAKPAAKPAAAAAKPEKKASKKEEKGIHAIYKVEGDKATRLRPTCERCGPGYFMADHHDRFTCGHCGFTRYKRA